MRGSNKYINILIIPSWYPGKSKILVMVGEYESSRVADDDIMEKEGVRYKINKVV